MEAQHPRNQGMFLQLGLPLVVLAAVALWLTGCEGSPTLSSKASAETAPATTVQGDVSEPALPAPTDGPFHEFSFEEALSWSDRTGRPVVVDFFTTWCGPCKTLDRTTWRDPDVVRWLTEKTIALKIDADQQKELARSYRLKGYPTVIVLDSKGREKHRLLGLPPIQDFAQKRAAQLLRSNG